MGTSYAKVISKFYRLKLADELRRFLDALPVRNVHESQTGDNIYMANGELRVGATYYPVGIRVWLKGIRVVAQISAPKAGVTVFADPFDPFGTAEMVRVASQKQAS
jgi:hypothetical protein